MSETQQLAATAIGTGVNAIATGGVAASTVGLPVLCFSHFQKKLTYIETRPPPHPQPLRSQVAHQPPSKPLPQQLASLSHHPRSQSLRLLLLK